MLFLAERVNIMEFNETMKINLEFDKEKEVREIVAKVYEALKIKGYDQPKPIEDGLFTRVRVFMNSLFNMHSTQHVSL